MIVSVFVAAVCACSLSHKTPCMQELASCLKKVILIINKFQSMWNLCNTASTNICSSYCLCVFQPNINKACFWILIEINLKVPWGLGIKTCVFLMCQLTGMNAAIIFRILQHLCFTAMNDKYFREPHLHLEVRSAGWLMFLASVCTYCQFVMFLCIFWHGPCMQLIQPFSNFRLA
jgi:hypothetical protein